MDHLTLTPEITRTSYQKRHSLNTIDTASLLSANKPKRSSSYLGLPRLRSKSQNSSHDVTSLVFRVVVIGSKRVGKTSLIRRYLYDTYTEAYKATVSDIFEKTLTREDERVLYAFKIHDTAGDLQFEFPAMFGLTAAEGDMFILVYSVENKKSFDLVESVWKEIVKRKERHAGDIPVVLVANKSDVSATRRKVTETEGQKLAETINCPFFEVSAKTGNQIGQIYDSLLRENDKIHEGLPEIGLLDVECKRLDNSRGDAQLSQDNNSAKKATTLPNKQISSKRKKGNCSIM
eukprot:Seg1689.10 transcript_id=Seg1689.10/GoldUCD/mRNA.D3Y31 product="GTP-binding protein Rhes" protein_id=Seg1689.10/GoldUCD/D3Y31